MKKFMLLAVVLFTCLTACGRDSAEYVSVEVEHVYDDVPVEEPPADNLPASPIVFSEANAVLALRGYTTTAQVGTKSFYFRVDDYELNSHFVRTTENLMIALGNYITVPRHPLRLHLSDEDITSYTIESRSLSIHSHSDKNTFGWIVHFMFSGRIPVWLSTGIEAVAKSDIGVYMPSYRDAVYGFGDFLLSPKFWGTEVQTSAINTAYHFTRHLLDINQLETLIEKYRNSQDDWTQANTLASQLFFDYFNSEMDADFILTYIYVGIQTPAHAYKLTTHTNFGVYNFIFDCFGEFPQNIKDYVRLLDSAIEFTINWYSQFVEFEAEPIRTNIFERRGYLIGYPVAGWASPEQNLMHIYSFLRSLPHTAGTVVHEASHIINQFVGKRPMPSLDEGLAETLAQFYMDLYFYEYVAQDYRLAISHIHARAYYRVNHTDYTLGGGFPGRFIDVHEFYVAALNTHLTSTSFVYWLILTYGTEYYMQVHWDVENFINVYGRTIFEMVDEWRLFLQYSN